MREELILERLEDLGKSEYLELKDVYCRLQDLRSVIARMHVDYVNQGESPAFDTVQAAYLMVEDIYSDLERYLLPICDPSSAYESSLAEVH